IAMSYSLLRRAALLLALLSPLSSYAVEMVLTSEVAASHWKTKYMNEFAQDVAKRTNGAGQVKVFPASQLYNDRGGLAGIGTGAVHMVWAVWGRLEALDAGLGYVNLPVGMADKLMENQCFANGLTDLIPDRLKSCQLQVLGLLRTADLFFIFRDRD